MKILHLLLLTFCFCLPGGVFGQWWENGSFDWNRAKRLEKGIIYAEIEKDSPRLMKMWVMRVDLNAGKFRFHVSGKSPEYGKTMPTHPGYKIHTTRQTTCAFMNQARKKRIRMVAAMNGSPWSPWDKVYSRYASRLGLLVSDGELISPPFGGRPSFIVYKDGSVDLKVIRSGESVKNIRQAISGFSFALTNGKVSSKDKSLAPRTGYGLSKDKRFLYFVVIDGRQKDFSMGASVIEVGAILKYLGAFNGLNMDGGGSSSFVIWNSRKKRAEMLNRQPFGTIRAVGASLGVSISY